MANSNFSVNVEMLLLIGCVGLLGIPHGASDHVVIADTLYTYFRSFWLPVFLVVYLGLVALVLLFWKLMPVVALFSFIAVSAIHFGLGDVDKKLAGKLYWLEVPIRGFMIMVLPCVHHTHNVDRIWTWLVGDEEQNRSVQVALERMHLLMPLWYVGICAIVVWHQYLLYTTVKKEGAFAPSGSESPRNRGKQGCSKSTTVKSDAKVKTKSTKQPKEEEEEEEAAAAVSVLKSDVKVETKSTKQQPKEKETDALSWMTSDICQHHATIVELFSIYALFASTTPLVAFIVYFCIWHSARHNFMVAAACFDRKEAVKALVSFFWASIPFTIGALGMGYAGFLYCNDEPESVVKVQLRMVFIGLNALTIPHMLFIELSDLRGRVRAGECANFIGMVMGTIVHDEDKTSKPASINSINSKGHRGKIPGTSPSSSAGKKLKTSPRVP
jgi:hypothetical protein